MKLFLLWAGVAAALAAAPHWEIQYRFQQPDTQLTLNDIAFPSAQRGIACGYITDHRGNTKSLVLATSDGGKQWSEVSVRETFQTSAGHDVNHLAQIEGLRAILKSRKK